MLQNKKILLVDDDIDNHFLFMEVLNEIEPDMYVNIAFNGEEAIKKLSKEFPLPDIILLDLNMPVMNGLECLAILKKEEKFKHIPVVMLTTSHNPPTPKNALKMGVQRFLTKAATIIDIRLQFQQIFKKDFFVTA